MLFPLRPHELLVLDKLWSDFMSEGIEMAFLKQQLSDMESAARLQRSRTINTLINLRVMLQDGDYDEALEMLDELVGDEES